MSKVLVTGATGFTGGALARRLVANGEQVVAFVRSLERARDLTALGIDCRVVDITDAADVERNFEPFARVFHIAALFRTEESDLKVFTRVNVDATRNLLESSRKHGVGRFIHCSTVGVQGGIDAPPANEDYRYHPEDHYQQTKMEGELLVREAMKTGQPAVVVRPAGIYGPGDTRFLKLFRGIQRGRFPIIGSGRTTYHFTYIDDLVDGFLLAGEVPEAVGQVFTIGGANYVTINDVFEIIAGVVGQKKPALRIPAWPVHVAAVLCVALCKPFGINPPLYPRRLEFFTLDRSFTIEKAKRLLGYAPKVSLREGFARTGAWYAAQGLLAGTAATPGSSV